MNSSEDNLRPFFTVGHEGGECVLFWMVGNYGSYSHFDTRVVGFPLTQEAGARICATAYRPVADDLGERPVMTDDGIDTLERHLTGCEVFLEYGSGGSTLFAGGLGVREIYSVESDAKWAHRVQERFDRRFGSKGLKLRTIHADIGPTGEWGFPTDPAHAAKWPNYALAPWRLLAARQRSPQVVLIDGRFRVACFLATLAFAEPGTIILFDDYVERPHYHLVETYCPRAAPHGRMGVFRVPETHDRRGALFDLVPHLTRPE